MGLLDAVSAKLGSFSDELARMKSAKANKDILEAMVAGCVAVGAADGDYSDKEKDETIDTIGGSKFIEVSGFSTAQISDCATKFTAYRPGSRGGRERLLEEIKEAGRRPETEPFKKAIFMSWIDIAEKDGNIDEKEKKVLLECADALGLRDAASLI